MSDKLSLSKSRTLYISLIATFLSLIPTIYVAVISNSLTLFADLLRCVVEFLAIMVAFLISRITRPENLQKYNYGFAKLEHFSSLVVAFAMIMAFIVISMSALQRVSDHTQIENAELGLYLAVLSVLGNIFIWSQNKKLAAATRSPISNSQAKLFLSKTVASVVVVISLTIGIQFPDSFFGYYADITGSLAVGIFLLLSSSNLIFHSLSEILDASLEESAQLLIMKSLVKFESKYKNIFKIRTRYGGGKNYIELWLEFEGHMILSDISRTCADISSEIEAQIPASEVVIVPISTESQSGLNN